MVNWLGRFIESFWRNRSDVLGVRVDFLGKFKQSRAELDTDVFAESARGSHYSEARELQMNPSNGSDRKMAVHRLLQRKHLLADSKCHRKRARTTSSTRTFGSTV